MLSNILLAIFMALVNDGTHTPSMCWANFFLIASSILILGNCGWLAVKMGCLFLVVSFSLLLVS